ncbi:MAG: 3-methyl-2-oxobutanoate hydroxymethyltransferase [Firmicutes bacterium]|nr:3-methyl-2-oxobutanoate hydroxymethyltransferase [Bacillota bacterium]
MGDKKRTPESIWRMKKENRKITLLTAYDANLASLIDRVDVDIILVSDAVGTIGLGRQSGLSVTVGEMAYHTQAVKNAVVSALVVTAMPYGSYATVEKGITSATTLIKEGHADAVHIEGGKDYAPLIEALTAAGIPVLSHIGLNKVIIARTGQTQVQGGNSGQALHVLHDALAVDRAGAFATMIECVPDRVTAIISEILSIPVIGIGAGPHCDGQALVTQDMLGLFPMSARFIKKYANLAEDIQDSLLEYSKEVQAGSFPDSRYSYGISDAEFDKFCATLKDEIGDLK